MPVRKILTAAHPALRKRARRVSELTPSLDKLIDDMIETMREAPGVGLAAPQVGVGQRVIVVEYAENEEKGEPASEDKPPAPRKLFVVINPEVLRPSAETVVATEGCLSVPGYAGEVERFAEVTVKGLNRRGSPVRLRARGWLARIFQHEVDHLDGVLYTDRARRVWALTQDETSDNV
jgi:peptide deformylase